MSWSELYLGPGTWILAVLGGGLLGMDAVSWPQVMVSRPLVSATVGGWLMGNPAAGMLVGAVLEVYALRHPPFGAAKYPDTGPAGLETEDVGLAAIGSGGGYALAGTAGQPDAGLLAGEGYTLGGGFWHGGAVSAAPYRLFLPLVVRVNVVGARHSQ